MDLSPQPETLNIEIDYFIIKKTFFDLTVVNNPNTPEKIKVEDNISYAVVVDIEKKMFKVLFYIKFYAGNQENSFLQVEAEAMFKYLEEVTKERLENNPIIKYNAPAIVFPLLRSFIAVFTLNAGIPPLYLRVVNFYKLGEDLQLQYSSF